MYIHRQTTEGSTDGRGLEAYRGHLKVVALIFFFFFIGRQKKYLNNPNVHNFRVKTGKKLSQRSGYPKQNIVQNFFQ